MKKKLFALPYMVWMVLFTVVPLLLIIVYAVFETTPTGEVIFTTEYLAKVFSPENMSVLLRSLWYAVINTVLCLVLAYPAALLLSKLKPKVAGIVSLLFILPMWMNFLLRTYAWQALLDLNGPINSFLGLFGIPPQQLLYTEGAVMMGLVYNFLPFMVFPIYTSLSKLDPKLGEAAQDLGCNEFRTLLRVTMPLSIPGVISGITMVFMPSVTTFFIPRVLGGGNTQMFGDLIESTFLVAGNWNLGSALSLIMMILILISLSILRKADPNGEGGGIV